MKVYFCSTLIFSMLFSAACNAPKPVSPGTSTVGEPDKQSKIFKPLALPPPNTTTTLPLTPVGVQILMSDGTIQTAPLGIWIALATGGACSPSCPTGYQLRGVFPTQYVNQIATIQPDGTWKYPKPGRNVQVWRNGLLQRLGPDYTLLQAIATLTPVLYPDAIGNMVGWNTDDYVTVAYLF